MPDVYISRAGMENKQLDEKLANVELSGLKDEIIKKDQEDKIKNARITKIESIINLMWKRIPEFAALNAANASIEDIEAALAIKRANKEK